MRKLVLLGALACVALVVVGVSAGGSTPRAHGNGPAVKLDNNGVIVRGFECVNDPEHGGGPIFTNETIVHLYNNINRDQMKCTFRYGFGSMPDTPYTERYPEGDCAYFAGESFISTGSVFFRINRYHASPKKGVLTCKHGLLD